MTSRDIATDAADDDDSMMGTSTEGAEDSRDARDDVSQHDGDHSAAGATELYEALKAQAAPTGVTTTGLLGVLQLLSDKWLSPFNDRNRCWGIMCERLGLDPDALHTPNEIDVAMSREIIGLMELFKYMDAAVHTEDDGSQSDVMTSAQTPRGIARRETFSRIAQVIHLSHKGQLYMSGAMCVANDDVFPTLGWEETAVTLFNDDSQRPHQIVLLHVLDLLAQPHVRYRKSGDSCYSEVITKSKYASHAFAKVCTITEFIYANITHEFNYPIWSLMTQSSLDGASHVAKFLEESVQSKFPELRRNRHLFAFENGLFDTEQVAFYPFAERNDWEAIAAAATHRLRPHYPKFVAVPPARTAVATNYFAVEFDAHTLTDADDFMDIDPSSIACDDALKIIEDQALDTEAIVWFFVFLGRLMYDVGTHDNWQLIFFLKGVAGCGKSTFVSFMRHVIGLSRVGVMASNAETKFALGPLYEKDMVACLETKRDFAIPQSDIQSMASGEALSIAIKHKPAETITWTAPLFFVGNELPDWRDASGSMARRLMLFVFRKRIMDVDTGLAERMQANTAAFLLRIVVSYRQAVILYGDSGIWGKKDGEYILPAQLRKFRDDMVHAVQPLMNYLNRSGQFVLCRDLLDQQHLDYYIPETVIRDGFRKWCKDSSIESPPWNEDLWHITFEDAGIARRHDTRDWDGDSISDFFLFGIGLATG